MSCLLQLLEFDSHLPLMHFINGSLCQFTAMHFPPFTKTVFSLRARLSLDIITGNSSIYTNKVYHHFHIFAWSGIRTVWDLFRTLRSFRRSTTLSKLKFARAEVEDFLASGQAGNAQCADISAIDRPCAGRQAWHTNWLTDELLTNGIITRIDRLS